jgi:hypothetical protein
MKEENDYLNKDCKSILLTLEDQEHKLKSLTQEVKIVNQQLSLKESTLKDTQLKLKQSREEYAKLI